MLNKENGFDLQLKWHLPEAKKYIFTFTALLVALLIIYGNSFYCSWHFDDFDNIVKNPNTRLESLEWENIKKAFYANVDGKEYLNRPLPRLTFALNYYIGGYNVFGYHVVNFAIHYLASIFLFLFIFNTFKLPSIAEEYRRAAYPVSLIAVFFWATHPIQVSSVTYIVQRMASMAGMFYIMAFYFYLKARTSITGKRKTVFFVLCGITGVSALASKENAAMLPVSIILFDLFLIQGLTVENIKKNLKTGIFLLLVILLTGAIYTDLGSILKEYSVRPFSLLERLLTEPRVVLFYISLLLYPISSRLMLLHDIEVSTSLINPWTTLPAILTILLIIGAAIYISRRKPFIAFCIIFYFLNHLIESTFIPLELIFEHTNYTPSMFFFVPIGILIINILDYFSYKKSIQLIMAIGAVSLLFTQGHTTYLRNGAFNSNVTLWDDNVQKAPNLNRPHQGLGLTLLTYGYNKEGLIELKKAAKAKAAGNIYQKYRAHFNLGTYYQYMKEYDKALEHFFKSLDYLPNNPNIFNQIAIAMFSKKSFSEAEKYILKAIRILPDSGKFYSTYSLILLQKGDADGALTAAKKAILLDGKVNKVNYFIGEAHRLNEELNKSVFYFERYLKLFPDHVAVNIALIELYDLTGNRIKLKQRVFHLLNLAGKNELSEMIMNYHKEYNFADLSRIKRIRQAIRVTLDETSNSLNRLLQYKSLETMETKKGTGNYHPRSLNSFGKMNLKQQIINK